MATLTETAFYTRKFVRWGIIGIIGFIILRIIFGLVIGAIRQAFPAAPLKPNNIFGKLPAISFPKTASLSGELTYNLQTVTGDLPTASEAARVFFQPKNKISFSSATDAQEFVGKMGFTTSPKQLSDTNYRWIDLKNPLRSIEVDIVSKHFTFRYAYMHDLNLFADKQIPTPQQANNESVHFLQSLNLDLNEINLASPQVRYLKLVGNQLEPTTSQSQADAVEINYYRNNIYNFPAVTPNLNSGIVSLIISGSRNQGQRILYVRYAYWPIETQTVGAYALKTTLTAWTELKSGHAYYVNFTNDTKQVNITNVYLAYYDSIDSQYYLQPIFVFVGENNFMAYVPAIAPPWTE